MTSFWDKLPNPFWALAPMEDVTDTVFRRVICSIGRPDVCFTEFTNVEAILAGVPAPLQRLLYYNEERPIVAQIWGVDPEKFHKASKIIKKQGFDGVDINFGCPVRDVVKIGACSAMIGKNSQVAEIIAAVKEGSKLPVSVKTRIGFKTIELSSVPAHWEEIGKAVSLRDQSESETLIVGNGDVKSLEEAREKVREYGVDGVMIGRGVLENPAIFNSKFLTLNQTQKLKLLKQHLKLWEETWGEQKNFAVLKKYIKIYVRDFEGAGELRAKLMGASNLGELKRAFLLK